MLMFYLFLFLAVLGLCCCAGFSLVAVSESYSLVAVCGLLKVVASPVAEHGFWAMSFSSCGMWAQ